MTRNKAPGEAARYRAVAEGLRQEILSGKVPPGARLPAERELALRHAVSLNTVRRALEVVATAGLVERRHGSGTYVRDPRRPRVGALVGLLVPTATSFFAEIIHGIEDELHAAGHRLLLHCSGYDAAEEQAFLLDLLRTGGRAESPLAGLLVAPSLHSADLAVYLPLLRRVRQALPTVLVERRLADDDAEFVSSDPAAGAALAVRHLAALGHRRIAFVGPARSAPATPIYDGYRRGLAEAGLAEDPRLVKRHFDWGRRGAADEQDVADLLALPAPAAPTGILCLGDEYAFRVYRALRHRGYAVPGDVALVAYDDVVAHLLEVPLTAVAPPRYEVGRQGAALLVRRLAEGDAVPIRQLLLKPRLVIRATCGGRPSPAGSGPGPGAPPPADRLHG